jgi:hypothetical protein
LQALQEASEETLGCIRIAPILNKDVEDNAVLIHSAPEIVLHTLDPDEHLIAVPLISWPWTATTHAVGKVLAEFPAPAPHGFVREDNTSLSQE